MSLARVLALVGGLALVAAFFMPWFASQNLLLSGQFLHDFLASAGPAQQRQFLPNTTPGEIQLLRVLVDVFPVTGAVAAITSLLGALASALKRPADVLLCLSGVIPLLAWAGGVQRLPAGATPEIGLWLIALGSLAVLVGVAVDVFRPRRTA
jgi:hypothetical protein